jgi:hypothetical protein
MGLLARLRGLFLRTEVDTDTAVSEALHETGAAAEIADYCRRIGISLKPGTESYRKIGIEFFKAKIAAGADRIWLPLPDGQYVTVTDQLLPPLPKIEPPIPVEPKPITDPPPPKKGAETFADAAAIYLKNELRDDVKPATVNARA